MINEDGIQFDIAKEIFLKKVADAGLVVPLQRTEPFNTMESQAHQESLAPAAVKIEDLRKRIYAILMAEITQDPCALGYAGKKDQEIADILNTPRTIPIIQDQIVPSRLESVVRGILNGLVVRPENLSIDIAGKCYGGTPDLQAAVDAAIQKEKDDDPAGIGYKDAQDPMSLMTAAKLVKVTVQVPQHPRFMDVFNNVPYVLNIVTADDITAARSA